MSLCSYKWSSTTPRKLEKRITHRGKFVSLVVLSLIFDDRNFTCRFPYRSLMSLASHSHLLSIRSIGSVLGCRVHKIIDGTHMQASGDIIGPQVFNLPDQKDHSSMAVFSGLRFRRINASTHFGCHFQEFTISSCTTSVRDG